MEDNEPKPPSDNQEVAKDDTQVNPLVNSHKNDTEDTDKNAAGDHNEVEPATEKLGFSLNSSPQQAENPPSEEDEGASVLNSSNDSPSPVEEPQININCDGGSTETKVDQPDGGAVPSNKGCGDNSATVSEGGTLQDNEGLLESAANENQEPLSQEAPTAGHTGVGEVETIGPGPDGGSPIPPVPFSVEGSDNDKAVEQHVTPEPQVADIGNRGKSQDKRKFWIAVALVALAAVVLQQLLQPKSPPQKTNLRQIDIFHQEMEKVKVQFPSQREELWKRSRIHLQRHFQITQPTEPVSLILTAGVRAEGTLHCLAQSIASALSSALNASALHIDGASKSSQDSDKVKSDIDSQLQRAFEGDKPIAVIHRFEELPPASTLIFYRYCDHENAAFKKTFIIFTVLLGEEEEIQAKIRLREVEEMVTDHLQNKFLTNGHPTAFDKMDIDKYGGLWSRISHLILPVATEKRIGKNEQC